MAPAENDTRIAEEVIMTPPSTSCAPKSKRWQKRYTVGFGVAVCGALFLAGLSLSSRAPLLRSDDAVSVSVRRNLLLSSEATSISYVVAGDSPHIVASYLVPPEPSPIPQDRVYGGMNVDEPEETLDFLSNGCRITSQVRIVATSPKWILQSIDKHGQRKRHGGDEFYVTYTDNNGKGILRNGEFPTTVAHVKDLEDGTYELDFVTTPMDPRPEELSGSGSLRVYFQYSCGIGFLPPYTKRHWKSGGSSHFFHKLNNIPEPPMRLFQAPSLNGICFSDFTKVLGVGDSVMNMMFANGQEGVSKHFIYKEKLKGALTKWSVLEKLHFINDMFGEYVHGGAVNNGNSVAMVVGSSTWDVLMDDHQDAYFGDHFDAVRDYIKQLRIRFPKVTLIWMAPNALHIHRVTCKGRDKCAARIKYLSSSRAEYLYWGQKQIMEEMGVPFLDVYEAYYLSSEWCLTGDGRHYNGELTNQMIHWFFDQNDCDKNAKPSLEAEGEGEGEAVPVIEAAEPQTFVRSDSDSNEKNNVNEQRMRPYYPFR